MELNNLLNLERTSTSIIPSSNYNTIPFSKENFHNLEEKEGRISFIDGGNCEILSSLNFNLSFVRIVAVTYNNNKLEKTLKEEYYVLTTTKAQDKDIFYVTKILDLKFELIQEMELNAKDPDLSNGTTFGDILKTVDIARKFLEVRLTKQLDTEYIVLDGNLKSDSKIIQEELKDKKIFALSKTNRLFTNTGNSLTVELNQMSDKKKWYYYPLLQPFQTEPDVIIAKLHESSKYIFKIEFLTGDYGELLNILSKNSKDPVFLGYPYGLIMVDKLARVTNNEKEYLKIKLQSLIKNQDLITQHLNTINAHNILDNIY